jgi:hypothetical protein
MLSMTGYAAVLDVLGFSSRVRSPNGLDTLDRYLTCVESTMRELPSVRYVVFSDSLVLTTDGEKLTDLLTLATACSRLMANLFEIDVPVRGAISHGLIVSHESDDKTGTFVAGTPIIEAYEYERAQGWVGVIVAPSVRRRLPDLEKGFLLGWRCIPFSQNDYDAVRSAFFVMSLIDRADVPLQGPDNGDYSCLAIIPSIAHELEPSLDQFTKLVDGIDACLGHLRRMKSFAPNPKAQGKFKTTINWLDGRRTYWHSARDAYQAYETDHPQQRT